MDKKCLRCGKNNVDIHTCTPNDSWRDGFDCATLRIQHMIFSLPHYIEEENIKVKDLNLMINKIQIEIEKIKENK